MKPKNEWPLKNETIGNDEGGWYEIPFEGRTLIVVSSLAMGWDHVSVSLKNRCPNWREMCHIKDLFWNDDEVVIQYHPAKKDYINNCATCLHLWKPQDQVVPTPPTIMVGI